MCPTRTQGFYKMKKLFLFLFCGLLYIANLNAQTSSTLIVSNHQRNEPPSQRTLETFAPWINQDTNISSRMGSTPFVGDKTGSDFGNSRYDRRLNPNQVLYGNRSLEELRREQRNAEMKSITISIFIALGVIILVFVLIKTSKSKEQ